MKTAIFVAAGAGIASASMRSLNANLMSLARSQNATGRITERAFQGFVARSFEPLNGYGCWCYLDDTWRDENQVLINRPAILAHGQVQDPLDELCRSLINSYKCIEMDAEAAGMDDCDAQSVEYEPYNFFSSDLSVESECITQNENKASNGVGNCAVNACIVEGTFTMELIDYVSVRQDSNGVADHEDYNPLMVHESKGGPFDPIATCPGVPNPVGSDKQCCGDHTLLTRKPYRLYSGFTTRSCCAGTVINNELDQCCVNNGVEVVTGISEQC
jgi:hypothetical protein